MPFRLKNAGATYQRVMNTIFHKYIDKFIEVYIDDVVIKSDAENIHLDNLRLAFEKMHRHNLKMNPLKCALGVSAETFLDLLFTKRGSRSIRIKQKL